MNTLEQYESEHQTQHGGWRKPVGNLLAVIGFFAFANATIFALFWKTELSVWAEIGFLVAGGVIGIIGIALRSKTREGVGLAVGAVASGVICLLLNEWLGFWGLAGFAVLVSAVVAILQRRHPEFTD